jgi:alpha-tubulin suppressor-like RCC1 family protein
VSGITNATAIAGGGDQTCALLSTGSVDCWGTSGNGQLGNGTTTESTTPVAVSGITDATAVTAGEAHNCALLSTGSADRWGYDGYGQLGDGTTTDTSTPVAVLGITNAIAVSAGYWHTCALLSTGSVDCWGYNSNGELGDGTRPTARRRSRSAASPDRPSAELNAGAEQAPNSRMCSPLECRDPPRQPQSLRARPPDEPGVRFG